MKTPIAIFLTAFATNILSAQSWQDQFSKADAFCNSAAYDSAIHYVGLAEQMTLTPNGDLEERHCNNLALREKIAFAMHNFSDAVKYGSEAKTCFGEWRNYSDTIIYHLWNQLIDANYILGFYEKSLEICLELHDASTKLNGTDHEHYGEEIGYLSVCYFGVGQYEKSVKYAMVASELMAKTLGTEHPDYGVSLNNLAVAYTMTGQLDNALTTIEMAIENKRINYGEEHEKYLHSQGELAAIYVKLGYYERARQLYEDLLPRIEKNLGKIHPAYRTRLGQLADVYQYLNRNKDSLAAYLGSIQSTIEAGSKDSWEYGQHLTGLSALYYKMQELDKAMAVILEAEEVIERTIGKNNALYAACLGNRANILRSQKLHDEAGEIYKEVLLNREGFQGKRHPDYGTTLYNLGSMYRENSEDALALGYMQDDFNILLENANMVFRVSSERDKLDWIENTSYRFDYYRSTIYDGESSYPESASFAYDLELASKGMALRSMIRMRETLQQSGDLSVMKKFDLWETLNSLIAKQYSLPTATRRKDLIELEKQSSILEKELANLSSSFNEGVTLLAHTWKDVQKNLKVDEVAIEFTSFRYNDGNNGWTDSTLYGAVVLRKEDEFPTFFTLFEQKQLEDLLKPSEAQTSGNLAYDNRGLNSDVDNTDIYNNPALHDLIWKPLIQIVNPGTTIYYAPSGMLNSLSHAGLMCGNGKRLIDQFNLVQMSSTAGIATSMKSEMRPNHLTLFGGINYNDGANVNSTTLWPYLPGTLEEVKEIGQLAKRQGLTVSTYSGKDASEKTFQTLAGIASPDVLHFATHGFFLNENDVDTAVVGKSPKTVIFGQQSLSRSGLVLANVNANNNTAKFEDDGLLTALEVSYTSLPNTGLVVLSACETGLGKISGSEGVMGLQRAFKAAGVEYILMSLWKIPDRQTSELMNLFYDNWLEKEMPLRNAFRFAQLEMSRRYKNPYSWAGFVLVN